MLSCIYLLILGRRRNSKRFHYYVLNWTFQVWFLKCPRRCSSFRKNGGKTLTTNFDSSSVLDSTFGIGSRSFSSSFKIIGEPSFIIVRLRRLVFSRKGEIGSIDKQMLRQRLIIFCEIGWGHFRSIIKSKE